MAHSAATKHRNNKKKRDNNNRFSMVATMGHRNTTVQDLRNNNLIAFECVAGSRAYGLATATSDVDIRGVFILPERDFFGLHYAEQINADNNNVVYYELRRFVELLLHNNPNILELLGTGTEHIRIQHPLFSLLTPPLFLSKRCKETFGNYAYSQIQKARGLNKKIVNPIAAERKTIVDFCYVLQGYGSLPLRQWLADNGYVQERCGLVRVPHFRDTYAVFYSEDSTYPFRGIMLKENSDDVATSSVPKGSAPVALLSFNREGYSKYCRDFSAYRKWEKERNHERYHSTLAHGKNYDAKNMMHVFRLLAMAAEIAEHGEIRTHRTDRDELLAIRSGTYSYEELVERAEQRIAHVEQLFAASSLPDAPDEHAIEHLLVHIRQEWYKQYNR